MNIQSTFINVVIEEAKKSDHKQKVGCIIFDKKKILSKGHNVCQRSIKKLHPKFQRYPFSVHAEVLAIINAKRDLRGTSLLVVRINKKNQFRLSKPCKDCMKYIEYVKIKNIFYTIDSYPYLIELTV
jgi:deoxycytidylate deaminase